MVVGERNRRSVVLLAVLVVLVVLTLAAYEFSELMSAEHQAAYSYVRYIQARAMAESGIQYAAAALSNSDNYANVLNSNPWNNPQAFQNVVVQSSDETNRQGVFSLIAPLSPDLTASSGQSFNYGVTDESGKINLNAIMQIDSSGQALYNMLMNLPNMTEDVANSILDWLDKDDTPRADGAESSYYGGLNPPYQAKNGPLNTLEELLLVKGVTPQLLFGNDYNRNGLLDAGEDNGGGGHDPGWSAYLTVSSRERNIDSSGNPRIYLNDSNLNNLYTSLSSAVGTDLANYIIAYRIYGPANTATVTVTSSQGSAGAGTTGNKTPSTTGNKSATTQNGVVVGTTQTGRPSNTTGSGGGGGSSSTVRLSRNAIGSFSQGQPRSISSVYQLVNSSVSIPASTSGGGTSSGASGNQASGNSASGSSRTGTSSSGSSRSGTSGTASTGSGNTGADNSSTPQATIYPSPLNDPGQRQQLLPILLDKTTTVNAAELSPRINLNTAPSTVLLSLPGLSETDVQAITQNRPDPSSSDVSDPIFQTPAWPMLRANITANKMQTLDRYITASTQVYRVQSLGYFKGGGPTARIEAVIDTNNGRPRIIYWRDLTQLGKGYNLTSQ